MARKQQTSEKEIVVPTVSAVSTRRKPATTRRATRSASVASASASASPVAEPEQEIPLREQIAELAYSYWVARGCQGGSPEEDWLHAERELSGKTAAAAV